MTCQDALKNHSDTIHPLSAQGSPEINTRFVTAKNEVKHTF